METKTAEDTRAPPLDRAAWIKGAFAILAEHGPAGLRVEVLAKRLDVTKGSFYWHFKDRRDLLDAVLDEWKDGRIRDIRKQTTAQPGGELAALRHTIDVYSASRNRKGIPIEAGGPRMGAARRAGRGGGRGSRCRAPGLRRPPVPGAWPVGRRGRRPQRAALRLCIRLFVDALRPLHSRRSADQRLDHGPDL